MSKNRIKNATIEELIEKLEYCGHDGYYNELYYPVIEEIKRRLKKPKEQPERTVCKYCHEDSDGFVYPIEKNSHAWLVRRGKGMNLRIGFKGEHRECCILFCPMCGRRLNHE